ncbi:MAG: DUF423 domain-containing protein [Planctomycetota bacterium]
MRHTAIAIGTLAGFLGVALGAFGAHGLEGVLDGAPDAAERLEWWETAARYQLVHAVALVAVTAAFQDRAPGRVTVVGFTLGMVVFSGTLYAMALGGPRWLGAITPLGGILLMAGWLAAAVQALRSSPRSPG